MGQRAVHSDQHDHSFVANQNMAQESAKHGVDGIAVATTEDVERLDLSAAALKNLVKKMKKSTPKLWLTCRYD